MAISPRTDQFMQVPSQDEETGLFEQGFTQAAEGMLLSKIPEVADRVISFKIIKSDIESGSAIGAFIVEANTDSIFIPVVLLENELKPVEVMFVRKTGNFLPLSPEWLQEVERDEVEPLGEGVPRPDTLQSDVDISQLVRPPYEGRFSFASAQSELKLLDFLSYASDNERVKLASTFKEYPDLLRAAVNIYGQDDLLNALSIRRPKIATAPEPTVFVATRSTPGKIIKEVFKTAAPKAMREITQKGYSVYDKRAETNATVDVESQVKLEDISGSGCFKLMLKDGSLVRALVVQEPINVFRSGCVALSVGKPTNKHVRVVENKTWNGSPTHEYSTSRDSTSLILTENGDCTTIHRSLIGEPVQEEDLKDVAKFKPLFSDSAGSPKKGYGVFVRKRRQGYEATEPVYVTSISTGSDGVRKIKYTQHKPDQWTTEYCMATDPKATLQSLRTPANTNLRYLPPDFKFIPCSDEKHTFSTKLVYDPNVSTSILHKTLLKVGSEVLSVHRKSDGFFYTSGDNEGRDKVATLLTLVYAHDLDENTAESLIKLANDENSIQVFKVTPSQRLKLAMGPAGMAPPQQQQPAMGAPPPGAPGGGMAPQAGAAPAQGTPMAAPGMQDPNQMDPNMAGQEMAPPPSPLDIAIQEVQEKITQVHEQQQAAIEQQMQSLQTQLEALQAVGARTEEIAQGVTKEESPALNESPTLNPAMMQDASQMYSPEMFDTAAISSLAESATLGDVVSAYMPTLMKSLDHLGRLLMTFWMQGVELKAELGEEKYHALEDRLRNIFKGVGDLLLNIQRNSLMVREGNEFSNEITR